jgi:fatty acid synthase
LDLEGCSRPFDIDANGYIKAEAVSVIFIQKRENCKRMYAKILNVECNNDGSKVNQTVPSHERQAMLMRETYERINFDVNDVRYDKMILLSTFICLK